MDLCIICKKTIVIDRKICSEECKKIYKKRKNKEYREKRKKEIIEKGKECERCGDFVHEPSMRKYCKKCKIEMKKIGYRNQNKGCYLKNQKGKCRDCENEIIKPKRLCSECIEKKKKESIANQTKQRKETRSSPKKEEFTGINPMFLQRGKIK